MDNGCAFTCYGSWFMDFLVCLEAYVVCTSASENTKSQQQLAVFNMLLIVLEFFCKICATFLITFCNALKL